jgi:hypothetical protein
MSIKRIDQLVTRYYEIGDMLVRIFTREHGAESRGVWASLPEASEAPWSDVETEIIGMDVKVRGEWSSFSEILKRGAKYHGLTIQEAVGLKHFTADDLPAYQLYELARTMVEENSYMGTPIADLPVERVAMEDRA